MNNLPARLASALADRYRVERELGAGGMATVYLATDLRHERAVALKVLRPELATALGPERFLREIKTTAQLNHPHILPLLDSGEAAGTLFYVMPLVEGESLRDRLSRERQLPLDDALQLTREVADALSYAHSRGIVHRDIKPENILLEGGHAVVADFGIARAVTAAGGTRLTETGLAVGTPAYMSPEQAMGGPDVDGRSDLYSLGCVLYEMLVGETPFTGPSAQVVLARKLSEPLPRVSVARETVPPGLEAALNKALARTPADRFRTVADFASALAHPGTLAATPSGAVPVTRPAPRAVRLRRLGIGAVVLAAAAAGTWALTRHRSPAAADPSAIPLDSAAIAVLPFHVVGADSAGPVRTLARSMGELFELKVTGQFGRRIRYPGSVAQRWRQAGGTLDSALSETAELAVGRAVGARWLVHGTIVASGDSLTLSASMLDVAKGAVRVNPVHVNGTLAQQQALVDRLIILLLAREAGYSPRTAPRLAQYKPEAIQAYVAANRAPVFSAERKALFRAALAADSNLADAALDIYWEGESERDTAELRYAWEHQDKLTERYRAQLQVLAAGRFGGVRTGAQVIAAYEDIARRWPEQRGNWGDPALALTFLGALSGIPEWIQQARDAFEREGSSSGCLGVHYAYLALMAEDTSWARAAIDGCATAAQGDEHLAAALPAFRWLLAILRGDSAGAALALARMPDSAWTVELAYPHGLGVREADRLAPGLRDNTAWVWAWARGREQAWRDAWRRFGLLQAQLAQATVPVYHALLLGPSEDARTEDAVRSLERLARGETGAHLGPDDRALARSWLALWRLRHGDPAAARTTKRWLEADESRRWRFVGWTRLMDVLLAEAEHGDVRSALLRMDSAVRELPLPSGQGRWDPMPAEVQNLFLARMLQRYGEPAQALAAARRRMYRDPLAWEALPEFLREEGRAAALVGDTAGALRAYRHYLALRENPDPPWRAAWDSVRVEYAALRRSAGQAR